MPKTDQELALERLGQAHRRAKIRVEAAADALNREMVKANDGGMSLGAIAKLAGVHKSRVGQVLDAAREEGKA